MATSTTAIELDTIITAPNGKDQAATINTNAVPNVTPSVDGESGTPETRTIDYPTGSKFYLIVFSISMLLVLIGLDTNIVATAVPAITDHFHTVADVGWYSAAFRLP